MRSIIKKVQNSNFQRVQRVKEDLNMTWRVKELILRLRSSKEGKVLSVKTQELSQIKEEQKRLKVVFIRIQKQ